MTLNFSDKLNKKIFSFNTFLKSAQKNVTESMRIAGVMLCNGWDTEKNEEKGICMINNAAKNGDELAKSILINAFNSTYIEFSGEPLSPYYAPQKDLFGSEVKREPAIERINVDFCYSKIQPNLDSFCKEVDVLGCSINTEGESCN